MEVVKQGQGSTGLIFQMEGFPQREHRTPWHSRRPWAEVDVASACPFLQALASVLVQGRSREPGAQEWERGRVRPRVGVIVLERRMVQVVVLECRMSQGQVRGHPAQQEKVLWLLVAWVKWWLK